MLKITAYLRNEADLALWKALHNKAQWLSDRLNEDAKPLYRIDVSRGTSVTTLLPGAAGSVCKNGHPIDWRGRCFGKGCKYA